MLSLLQLTGVTLSALNVFALASPLINDVSAVNRGLEARDEWQPTASTLTCLYLTNEPEWAGEGINPCEVGGTCASQLPDGLSGNVSSAGPEAGVTCFLYSEQDCAGDRSAPLVNPGYADLSTIKFDKKARSWQCWKWCGWMGTSSASSSASSSAAATTVRARSPRLVSITTTIDADSQTATTAPGLPEVSSSPSSLSSVSSTSSMSTASSSQAIVFETSMTTIVVTHTYEDGSTTVMTTPLAIPVPVLPSSTPENDGGVVSISTTEGQTLEGPTPFTTPGAGVSITTTLSATHPESTPEGVSITTTESPTSPAPTLTSEGVTVPVPSVSSVVASSSSSRASSPSSSKTSSEEPGGWTSLVTLTGVDATLTVTAAGGPAASSTS